MSNWSDLGPRVASATVMSVVGSVAIWLGHPVFLCVVLVCVALMAWEILEMCEAQPLRVRKLLPISFACILYLCVFNLNTEFSWLSLLAAVLISFGLIQPLKKQRAIGGVFLFAIFFVGYGLISFREHAGFGFILWMILVIIASDVMGYFAGRTLGGPKFWPSISPKKTWSGSVAGWIGAALVGLGFVIWNGSPAILILISVATAFAGQMGDIAESALKRKVDVKDSSNLIPGHGGVLDRFDAVSGAVLFLLALSVFVQITV